MWQRGAVMPGCSQRLLGTWGQPSPRPPNPASPSPTPRPWMRETGQKVPMWEKSHGTRARREMQVRHRPACQVTPGLWQGWIVTLNLHLMAFKLLFILKVSHQKLTGEFSVQSQLSKQTATPWHLQLDSYKERGVYTAYSIYWWRLRNALV